MLAVATVAAGCGGGSAPKAAGPSVAKADKQEAQQSVSKVRQLTKADFITLVYDFEKNSDKWVFNGDKPAIVDFYATWCGPCKMIAPILDELAAEYADEIVIFKIDIDKEKELTSHFGIKSIPTLFFIPMEGEPHILQGAMSKDDFKKIIDSVLLDKE